MKEILLVVGVVCVAHVLAWCRDPMAGWRQRLEDECRQGVEEYDRVYGIAVVSPVWMTDEE